MSSKSIQNSLNHFAKCQTNRQTKAHRELHNLLGGGDKKDCIKHFDVCIFKEKYDLKSNFSLTRMNDILMNHPTTKLESTENNVSVQIDLYP